MNDKEKKDEIIIIKIVQKPDSINIEPPEK